MAGQQHEKWQQVAELIQRLGLVSSGQDEPRTAAQVARMTTRQLLQDPVRAAIYNRGWADRTADIQRRLRPQRPPSTPTPGSRTPSLTRPSPAATTAAPVTPAPITPVEPSPVPGSSGAPTPPAVKVRTEAQLARNRRKFQQLKEKRKAREREASQQHRPAKQPAPTLNPEAASEPLFQPTPPVAMEVDVPTTEDGRSEESERPTNQPPPNPITVSEPQSEDAWLEAPGLSLDGLPEVEYDNKSFFTPVGSPRP